MSFWKDWSDGTKWIMGIASALVVAAVLGLVGYTMNGPPGAPSQRVSFVARSDPAFGIQSEFEGSAKVNAGRVTVEVTHAKIAYPRRSEGYNGPRRIVDLRVSLAKPSDESWEPVRRSSLLKIDRGVVTGDEFLLDPFELTMSIQDLQSLSGFWLVFDISSSVPGDSEQGYSHAHSRVDLFSD